MAGVPVLSLNFPKPLTVVGFPQIPNPQFGRSLARGRKRRPRLFCFSNQSDKNSSHSVPQGADENLDDLGVKAALCVLRFYKNEISPILPKSCRYIPTCSEYSMEAYKKYGSVKGTILTAWRICRCNPLGGSGYDPPRWFDEASPSDR